MAQLAFKQVKFYFQFQNNHTKGNMGSSWTVMSFTEIILESQPLEKDLTFLTAVLQRSKTRSMTSVNGDPTLVTLENKLDVYSSPGPVPHSQCWNYVFLQDRIATVQKQH